MVRIKDIKTITKNYVEKPLMTFIEGGKYTRDKKPQSLNWIMGIIRESGIEKEDLVKVFGGLKSCPKEKDEVMRYNNVFEECQKQNYL
ncbi:MAG: hypothetical protein COV69_01030 [Parcubacteria group bacterium CG11_big_fil_rev_8_21_14_0_20_39_14]|nr:MAG: hypothetical protein COV69_01030 [Parcubacteria group bacterium CG11_big_fil_rev_8_21_14_0_20_39_14]